MDEEKQQTDTPTRQHTDHKDAQQEAEDHRVHTAQASDDPEAAG
mgnify:CR=1 FL=1